MCVCLKWNLSPFSRAVQLIDCNHTRYIKLSKFGNVHLLKTSTLCYKFIKSFLRLLRIVCSPPLSWLQSSACSDLMSSKTFCICVTWPLESNVIGYCWTYERFIRTDWCRIWPVCSKYIYTDFCTLYFWHELSEFEHLRCYLFHF